MTYLEYLQLPDSVASLKKLYAFGVVSEAQYIRSELLLAYIDLRQQSPRPSDSECAYLLSKNPYYALSEGSILQIIKWAKRRV
jgi:hypothetical protein